MLVLNGARNFRDLGGYATRDGRVVRHGLIFRSEGFHALTPGDIAAIGAFGFRLRCDLRSQAERDTTPNLWPDAADGNGVLLLDLGADPRAANQRFFEALLADFSPHGAFHAMCTFQRELPRLLGGQLAPLFDRIIDERRLPAVIHCHHGKDRTGFVAAILLRALDVPLDLVLEDYLKTNDLAHVDQAGAAIRNTIRQFAHRDPSEALVAQLTHARPEYLLAGLEQIEADHGSIAAFLAAAAGVDDTRLTTLKEILLIQPR